MLDPRASRFYQAALQSGLIDEAGLGACWGLVPAEKRTPDAIDRRLARQAITTGRLTLWQAQQLLAGRSNGYKIDKYVLLDLLGRGGMGRVYLARDVRLNRQVALKILSHERMNNPRAIARFQREAKVGAQLQHENLVRVYDEGESGGIRYLVMEYIEGKNVGQLIGEHGSIPWPTAARLTRQVALGLEHARLKELIHRDVNPCNILVTRDGTAKLTDLGLAIDLNDQDNVTRDGATVGTFDYVSPEQARHSRSVDTRADLYSLGCTIYHMIAGRVPFPVISLPEKLYAHQLHEPDPLPELVPGVPEGLAEVVRKMMRKTPEERYQTPLEVASALEPYAVEAGWTTASAGDDAPPATAAMIKGGSSGGLPAVPAGTMAPASRAAPAAGAPSSWAASLGLGLGLGHDRGGPTSAGPGIGRAGSGGAAGPGPNLGDSFFPLDLGPDEPWAEGLNPPGRAKATTADAPRRARRVRVVMAAGGIAAALVALGTVASLATLSLSGPGRAAPGEGGPPGLAPRKGAPPLARGDVVIRFRDGTSEPIRTLTDAIARGTREGAEIILAGGTTLRMDTDKPIRVPRGSLTIRAAEGARTVLEIRVKGPRSMFLVDAGLRLAGLTVVVRYESPTDAPVFQAERDLTLERCSFRALGPAEGSRLILAEGPRLAVSGCLFEGFDCPVELAAGPGASAALKQSIFLGPRSGDEATGRALRVRSAFGGGDGFRLKVERCSSRTGCFLDASRFTAASPLSVDIEGSALWVRSILEVDSAEKPPLGPDSAVRWAGRADRYHVTGPAWANFDAAPTGLDAWSQLAPEVDSKSQRLKAAKEPPDPASPKDCALTGEDGQPVGADPGRVGPG